MEPLIVKSSTKTRKWIIITGMIIMLGYGMVVNHAMNSGKHVVVGGVDLIPLVAERSMSAK